MMAALIDRRQLKADAKLLLADAQASPKAMTALYLCLVLALNLVSAFADGLGLLTTFVSILTSLLIMVLGSGFTLYCMNVRRGERAEFLTLFDGFSFVGKLIALNLVMILFVWLWSMLFVIPGLVAVYRYHFALYNLYENPGLGVMEALDMSKRQSIGYKGQLLSLDLSYIGWTLLASIPTVVYITALYIEQTIAILEAYGLSAALPMDPAFSLTGALPAWGWTLVMGLWALPLSLFYLPNYECVKLGYFEIAKDTSGIGLGARPRQEDPARHGGPGSTGGY